MTTTHHEDRWTIKVNKLVDFRPIGDKILVRPLSPEERSRGGIIIPDSAVRHPMAGFVVAVGSGRVSPQGVLIPIPVAVGDLVFFGRYAGTAVKTGDEEAVVIMCIDDVLGVATDRGAIPCDKCGRLGA